MGWGRRRQSYSNRDAERIWGGLAGPVIGAKVVAAYDTTGYPDRAGVQRWRLTSDLEDLGIEDARFVPCGDFDELVQMLEERYPGQVPGMGRVEPIVPYDPYKGYTSGRPKDYRPPAPTDACVHARPLLAPYLAARRITIGDAVDELQDLIANHGPVLITTEHAESAREVGDYTDSDLTINTTDGLGGDATPGYMYLKYNPKQAQARRSRQVNDRGRATAARDFNVTVDGVRGAFMAAAYRMYRDLCGVTPALDGIARIIREPAAWPRDGDHAARADDADRNGRKLYADDFQGAAEVRAYAGVYGRYLGRNAHRKLPEFQDLLTRLRVVRGMPDARPAQYGLTSGLKPWFEAELKARGPRATKPEDDEDARERPQDRPGRVDDGEAA